MLSASFWFVYDSFVRQLQRVLMTVNLLVDRPHPICGDIISQHCKSCYLWFEIYSLVFTFYSYRALSFFSLKHHVEQRFSTCGLLLPWGRPTLLPGSHIRYPVSNLTWSTEHTRFLDWFLFSKVSVFTHCWVRMCLSSDATGRIKKYSEWNLTLRSLQMSSFLEPSHTDLT